MEILFWVSVGLITYGYLLYPLGVFLAGLRAHHASWKDEAHLPFVSMIISAFNEEAVIEEKLRNSLSLDYPRDRLEIVVASESTDATNDRVRRYTDRGIVLYAFTGRRGKSATLYRIMPALRGEIVVFSDANALYRTDAIRRIVRNFADPSVGCVIGRMRYTAHSRTIGGEGEGLYWKYDLWMRKHANRIRGLVPGINGAIFAIRRDLYFPFSVERGDDYELCSRIVIQGHAAVFEPEAVAEERGSETTRQQFKRKSRLVRWNTVSSLLLLREAVGLKRWATALQIFSQRLLRYTMPIWLILAFVSSAALMIRSGMYMAIFFAQATFYSLALAGWAADALGLRLPKVCLVPSYFLMVNSAAITGLAAGLSRGQVTTWQKTR